MNRLFSWILQLLILGVVMAEGVLLLFMAIGREPVISQVYNFLLADYFNPQNAMTPWLLGTIGSLLFFIVAAYLYYVMMPERKREYVNIGDEDEGIRISVRALLDFVRKVTMGIEGVKDVQVSLDEKVSTVRPKLLVKFKSVDRIAHTSQLIQEIITRELQTSMGLTNVEKPLIIVNQAPPSGNIGPEVEAVEVPEYQQTDSKEQHYE